MGASPIFGSGEFPRVDLAFAAMPPVNGAPVSGKRPVSMMMAVPRLDRRHWAWIRSMLPAVEIGGIPMQDWGPLRIDKRFR
jgi:hypothetical protein